MNEVEDYRTLFSKVEGDLRERIGFVLFTLLLVEGDMIRRVYSSAPDKFPVGGAKKMGPTPWGNLVIKEKQKFLARDKERLRWAFYDHGITEGMGGGSGITIPVVDGGVCIGVLSLTGAEFAYEEKHVEIAEAISQSLLPAFKGLQAQLHGARSSVQCR
jgi:hypothetical protein